MIRKWLHNRKLKNNPMCPCGWRMISSTRRHFEQYWSCVWDICTWEAFSTDGGKVKYWHE